MQTNSPYNRPAFGVFKALSVALLSLGMYTSYAFSDETSASEDVDSVIKPPVYKSVDVDDIWDVFQRAKTFDAVYQSAISTHGADIEVAEQAFGRLLPTITADAAQVRTHQEIQSSDNTVFGKGTSSYDSTRYGVTVSQVLFDWDVFSNLEQSDKEVLKANVDLQLAEQDLILRVAERYLTVLAAQDNLEFSVTEERAVKEQSEVAKARFDAKLGREADYLEAKARYWVGT